MRVIHVIPSRPYGGAQILVAQLAGVQRAAGVDARVLAIYPEPRFFRELDDRGVPYYSVDDGDRLRPWRWRHLSNWVRSTAPDLICFHTATLWVLLALSLNWTKACPWVYQAHIYPPVRLNAKNRLIRFILASKIDAVIGVSASVTAASRQFLGPAIEIYRTIYNGVDLPKVHNSKDWPDFMDDISPGRPLIGMATRFAGNKGVKEFLEAAGGISHYLPEARFVLAGEGPLLTWAQDYAVRSGLRDKLVFPGFIRDMPHFWAALDFALFTGPKEPFGLRIVEPQAANTVVAGYCNGSGSDEIIIPGETGIMVDWGRREDLAREMATLWSDPGRYAQIATAARNRLQTHFSLSRMSTQCIELYENLIGRYPARV